jgi:diguanylate cyclase (GGDEF)-like protein
MKNTLLLFSKDPDSAQRIKSLFWGSQHEIVLSSSMTQTPATTLNQVFLVLLPDCNATLLNELNELNLPPYIPALALGTLQPSSSFLQEDTSGRLIDYLENYTDRARLTAKINFLRKVSKLSFEHSSYLKNHDSFLEWFTSRDGLTGLYNRHHFNKTLHTEYQEALDNGTDLSVLIIDIDYFNEINKTCGQSFGDFVLNVMSSRLTAATRNEDICFRLSGGDFVVLMPGVDLITARKACEKIVNDCTEQPFCRNELERRVTLSIGIASYATHHPATVDEFVNMAETALFKAKADGRDRVYIYAPREANSQQSAHNDFDSIKVTINRVLEKTRHSAITSLQLLARDIAGPRHRDHIDKVSRYTELLCTQLGLTPPIIRTLQNSSILYSSIRHLIHNDLLSKKELFTAQDKEIMEDFPYKLSEVIDIFDYFSQERLILLTRSEKFDGSGYPEGLKGNEIPLGARIVSIVDSLAAMEADRPYRDKFLPEDILNELKNEAGKQFDPFLVLKLLETIQKYRLLDIPETDIATIHEELLKLHSNAKP